MEAITPELPATTDLPNGYHLGVSFDDYIKIKRVNSSTLPAIDVSPMEFRHRMEKGGKSSTSKRLGTGFHSLMLEPDRFMASLVTPPINPKTGKAYGDDSQKFQDFAAANPGKLILSQEDLDKMVAMAKRCMDNEAVRACMENWVAREQTMLWIDPATGVRCKGRVDLRTVHGDRVDFKSTLSVDEDYIAKSIVDYGYHTQSDFYGRGDVALGNGCRCHTLIFIQNEPPHDVCVCSIGPTALEIASVLNDARLSKVATCIKAGKWPGVMGLPSDPGYNAVRVIEAPQWYLARFTDGEGNVRLR